ncbi:hypothetical protein F5883DRAFT_6244 [Diaporthe sp. PMI_573]|nr:hypothetical protein F5883DRAFT_6244 [Diaporthaceae sp. PMI_573]
MNIRPVFNNTALQARSAIAASVSPNSSRLLPAVLKLEARFVRSHQAWMAGWMAGWVISPSVVAYWWRRQRLVRPAWIFSRNGPGFWIVSSCQPHAHVNKQLPKIFSGLVASHTFRLPLFQFCQDNLSLHQQGRARSAARQALVLPTEYLGRVKLSREGDTSSSQFDATTRLANMVVYVVRRIKPHSGRQ